MRFLKPFTRIPPPAMMFSVVEAFHKRSAEHMLYSHLFKPGRYRRSVRPVTDYTRSVQVRVGVAIMTIDDIVEKDQWMITSGAVKMKWNDEFLRWNPEDFQNLTWFALPSSDIWLPDIAMTNSPDPYMITRRMAYAEISNTGDVGYYPSGRWTSRCHISLHYFPFDWQECALYFESWVYPNTGLSIEPWYPNPIDMKDYYKNHQWDLSRYAVSTGNVSYDGIDFSFIRYRFFFRRKILYYCILVIFPCTLMSILQILSHTLAVEHPARATVLTSLFVSSTFLQGSLAAQMPKSSEGVTLVQIYLMIMSLNLIISLVVTFINMHVWFRVPTWPVPTLPRMLHAYLFDVGTTAVDRPLLPAALLKARDARHQREEKKRKAKERLERRRLRREKKEMEEQSAISVRMRLNAEKQTTTVVDEEKETAATTPLILNKTELAKPAGNELLEEGESSELEEEKPKSTEPEPTPLSLPERKERWLKFSRVIDKVFLIFMTLFNLLSPVIIFGLVPLYQAYYYEYDEENVEYFVTL